MTRTLAKPNLFLVGAMKSGSSSLTHYLHAHPDIFMTMRPKEPSYFVDQKTLKAVYPAMERLELWRDEANYLKLFADAGDAKYIGDSSQNYSRLPLVQGVAQRIADFRPDAKILYIVRDPVLRTISHYWYMVSNFGETRPLFEAILACDDYMQTSYYAMQLRPFLDRFGVANVHVVTAEELRQTPETVMQDIYSWLGIDASFTLPDLQIQANATPKVIRQARGSGCLYRLRHSVTWDMVGKYVPQGIRQIGTKLSERTVDRGAVDTEEIEAYLKPIQEAQVAELVALTGRSYDVWTRFQ